MNWPKRIGICLLGLGATGCATDAHRSTLSGWKSRADAFASTPAPKQVQVSLPPEQPDIFMAAKATRESPLKLSRYFPGLGRTTPATAPATARATAAAPVVAQRAAGTASPVAVATSSVRPSWFGFRKPKGPQTYVTDAAVAGATVGAQPSYLPVALQVPFDRIKDRSVTPTTAEVATQNPAAGTPPEPNSAPSNPDSSSAAAEPIKSDEPQLAVKPFQPAGSDPKPAAGADAELKPSTTEPESKPAEEPAATAPEERQEPAPTPPAPTLAGDDAKQPAAAPPTPEPNPTDEKSADAQPPSSAFSPADPGHSLGLPPAMLPASYTQHTSVAVRGSHQAAQPPPVLASPQVEASPQSPAAGRAAAAKTWQRPCLRRLIRRKFQLGEFANPPTALPH